MKKFIGYYIFSIKESIATGACTSPEFVYTWETTRQGWSLLTVKTGANGESSLGHLQISLEMAHKVICPKKNNLPPFCLQCDHPTNDRIATNPCQARATVLYSYAQSRQSAKLFLQRWNWNSPTPLGAGGCAPPPPFGPGGRAHSLAAKGLGESQFQRGDIHCGALYM